MIRFAVLGAGRIGTVHAKNIAQHSAARLKYVVDVNEQLAAQLANRLSVRAVPLEAALDDLGVDAVVIATPTDTHAELIERAAAARKAIFCEKPIDTSVTRAQAAVDVVKRHQVPFFLAFNRRFDPHYGALREALQVGTIGKPQLILITSRDSEPPPLGYLLSSGTIFRHMTIHEIDLFRWLSEEEPSQVFATGSSFLYPDLSADCGPDTAVVTLKTHSGIIGVVNNSLRSAFGYDQRLEVQGQRGVLRVDNLKGSALETLSKTGVTTAGPDHSFIERFAAAYTAELDAFIGNLRNEIPMEPSAHDGLRASIIAECLERSFHQQVPIEVPG